MTGITDAKRLGGFIRRFHIFVNNKILVTVMAYGCVSLSLET